MKPVCYDVCIALILIAESPKQVINLVIHLGNPGLVYSLSKISIINRLKKFSYTIRVLLLDYLNRFTSKFIRCCLR